MPSSRSPEDQDDVPGRGTVHADASAPPSASLPAAAAAWEAVFRAHVTVMQRLQAQDVWEQLSPVEYDVLFTLARRPGQAMRLVDLNRQVLLSQPSLSRLVVRLAAQDLLERCSEPHDGRGTVVRLTPAGAALQRRIGEAHLAAVHRLVGARLSDAELAQLGGLADQLRAGAGEGDGS
jgi:DNA-binding MarR family transcriptional regulator